MQRRRLSGLEVSAVGLGCATMTPFYDEPDRDAAIDTLCRSCARSGCDAVRHHPVPGQGPPHRLPG